MTEIIKEIFSLGMIIFATFVLLIAAVITFVGKDDDRHIRS